MFPEPSLSDAEDLEEMERLRKEHIEALREIKRLQVKETHSLLSLFPRTPCHTALCSPTGSVFQIESSGMSWFVYSAEFITHCVWSVAQLQADAGSHAWCGRVRQTCATFF